MFNEIWQFIKSQASVLWHVVGGVVTGSILPTLAQSAIAGHMTAAGAVSTVVSGLVGAIVGYAQHSNNQLVAQGAAQITPAIQSQIDNAVTDKVTSAIASLSKKAGMVLLLFGFVSLASAQTIWKYNGGFNVSSFKLSNEVDGLFLSPLAQVSTQPIWISNGEFYTGTNVAANFAYALTWGKISPDVNAPTIDVKPDVYIDVYLGGAALQEAPDSGTYIGRGVVGFGIGKPSILGTTSIGLQTELGSDAFKSIGLAISVTSSFDVLDGFGVIQLR